MNASKAKSLAFLAVLATSGRAFATQDFPGKVEEHLMLAAGAVSMIAPPDGCHLCHVNGSAGGDPLTRFGTLMKANGAVQNLDNTVAPALDAIEATEPQFITDLKTGMDPNLDTSVPNNELVPMYGCGSMAPGLPSRSTGDALALVAAALGTVVATRRIARRSR